jgi:hypothetical protein
VKWKNSNFHLFWIPAEISIIVILDLKIIMAGKLFSMGIQISRQKI